MSKKTPPEYAINPHPVDRITRAARFCPACGGEVTKRGYCRECRDALRLLIEEEEEESFELTIH